MCTENKLTFSRYKMSLTVSHFRMALSVLFLFGSHFLSGNIMLKYHDDRPIYNLTIVNKWLHLAALNHCHILYHACIINISFT